MGLIEQFFFNRNHRERFHHIFVDVVLRQKTEKIIGFKVRWQVFFHLTMKVFRDLKRRSPPELHPLYAGNAVSRCFTSFPVILGFAESPKNGV